MIGKNVKKIYLALPISLLFGCSSIPEIPPITPIGKINYAVKDFNSKRAMVSLGDTKDSVLGQLLPGQRMKAEHSKAPEAYTTANGDKVEIFFLRSGKQPDGLTTDDEFTPFVFTNGILTAIGWHSLGGPHSTGKVRQPAPYINNSTDMQIINR